MIERLQIENFKTIRSLELPCKRYNLFIGDTNSGKTNIIEALTLQSQNVVGPAGGGGHAHEFNRRIIRYGQLNDLFPGRDVTQPLRVCTNVMDVKGGVADNGLFTFDMTDVKGTTTSFRFQPAGNQVGLESVTGDLDTTIRRYQYDEFVRFGWHWFTHLAPPGGHNLSSLLITNAELAAEVDEILSAKGVSIEINPETYAISLRHVRARNVVVPISYGNLSETLRRYVFLYVALRTNENAVLLLDEPEQNAFPFYAKHIAEIMAREASNQYFITTHNQYLLQAIVEKAPEGEVQVIATYRNDDATLVRVVPLPEVIEMMEYDLFLNLDRLVDN